MHHVQRHHLRFDERETIETVYNARLPPGKRKSRNQLAKDLGLAKSTLSREISRGRCDSPTSFAGRTFREYSAHKAQDSVAEGNGNKGCPMKVTNRMAARLRELILGQGYSPNHARVAMHREGFDMPRSTTTIYNRIEHGDIGIRRGQTPCHPKPRRKRRGGQKVLPQPVRPPDRGTAGGTGSATGRWTPSSPRGAAGAGCPS